MTRCNCLLLVIARGGVTRLEHDMCHILLIHEHSLSLWLSAEKLRPWNGQKLRRGGVVQHSGVSAAPHLCQHTNRRACLAGPEQAYPVRLSGMICRLRFPRESAG